MHAEAKLRMYLVDLRISVCCLFQVWFAITKQQQVFLINNHHSVLAREELFTHQTQDLVLISSMYANVCILHMYMHHVRILAILLIMNTE